MGVGAGDRRCKTPLDFKIWYFPVHFFVGKNIFSQFRVDKMKSHQCFPPWEKSSRRRCDDRVITKAKHVSPSIRSQANLRTSCCTRSTSLFAADGEHAGSWRPGQHGVDGDQVDGDPPHHSNGQRAVQESGAYFRFRLRTSAWRWLAWFCIVTGLVVRNQGQIGPKVTGTTDIRITLRAPLNTIIPTGLSILYKPKSFTETMP